VALCHGGKEAAAVKLGLCGPLAEHSLWHGHYSVDKVLHASNQQKAVLHVPTASVLAFLMVTRMIWGPMTWLLVALICEMLLSPHTCRGERDATIMGHDGLGNRLSLQELAAPAQHLQCLCIQALLLGCQHDLDLACDMLWLHLPRAPGARTAAVGGLTWHQAKAS